MAASAPNQTQVIGPKADAHLGRAATLDPEQRDQDAQRNRHDVGRKHRCRHLQPLHRREHRDGRRDQAVAVEQRGAEQPEQDDRLPRAAGNSLVGQHPRHQRHDAALSLVVGTQDQRHVLEGDDDDQRPEHQRQDAQHVRRRDWHRVVGIAEDFLERIERTGADVAIDHAESSEGEDGSAVLLGFVAHGLES
jgi:hypothetical protein